MDKQNDFDKESEAWDRRDLGADEDHVVVADAATTAQIDNALGLQAISIRLPKGLIEDLKALAHLNDTRYQPLIRDLLVRFVKAEKKCLAAKLTNEAGEATDRDTNASTPETIDEEPTRKCA